jgi:Amt family ammonium transporter
VASGAVAGLVAITPASGYVPAQRALVIGLVAGIVCYWGATGLKNALGYDDSLDAFGVHGIGGIVGALLTGVFATSAVAGDAVKGLIDGNPPRSGSSSRASCGPSPGAPSCTFVLLKAIDLVIGLRVDKDSEREGLDLTQHGETVA